MKIFGNSLIGVSVEPGLRTTKCAEILTPIKEIKYKRCSYSFAYNTVHSLVPYKYATWITSFPFQI